MKADEQGPKGAEQVKVVILAGGKGTRLRPFTASFPKPLVPLGDKPILEILLTRLAKQGFTNVTLSLGHLAELVRAYIDHRKTIFHDMVVNFVDEDEPTGTAGSLANVPGLTNTFLVMNGDILTDLDFGDLIKEHKASGAQLTIAAHRADVTLDFGVLEAGADGRLQKYVEKPTLPHEVSMGIYVYEPSVLSLIEKGQYLDFPTLVMKLLDRGEHVNLYRSDAFWLDIGRPDDYAEAQELCARDPDRFIS